MVIAKTASRNVAFKSDKIMDALFQGQSAAQTPQPFSSKAWPATRSCTIFLIRMIVRSRLGLISAMSRFIQYILFKVVSANTIS